MHCVDLYHEYCSTPSSIFPTTLTAVSVHYYSCERIRASRIKHTHTQTLCRGKQKVHDIRSSFSVFVPHSSPHSKRSYKSTRNSLNSNESSVPCRWQVTQQSPFSFSFNDFPGWNYLSLRENIPRSGSVNLQTKWPNSSLNEQRRWTHQVLEILLVQRLHRLSTVKAETTPSNIQTLQSVFANTDLLNIGQEEGGALLVSSDGLGDRKCLVSNYSYSILKATGEQNDFSCWVNPPVIFRSGWWCISFAFFRLVLSTFFFPEGCFNHKQTQ